LLYSKIILAMLIAKHKGDNKMTIYVCLHCEYRFDSEKGDPAYNIPAGATPADMPDDWVCPECAALGIEAFIAEEE
jgi:hydroxylamine reductase